MKHPVEPPNKGHFGANKNSVDLFSVERFSSLGGCKCIAGIILRPSAMSFLERFIVLCPYLGETTIIGSTVLRVSIKTNVKDIKEG